MAIPHGLAIRLIFLLILPILWALPGGHLPTLLAHPELPSQLQCFARCVAKCLVEDEHKSLSQCQTDCRQYGQPSLCGPQELARGKRVADSSSSREHQDHRHGRHPPPPKLSKNGECWARCKDLGLPPPSPPPPPPSELRAEFNENLTIDIHWKPTGPGAEKDRLFLIQLVSEVPNRQISQIFTQKASGYSGLALASAESICGPVSVQVAAVDASRGLGPMSKPVQLEGSGPRVPARMQLFAAKFNSTPFETDDYVVNGTLDVELQFQLNGWPFGLEDVEVNPVFHLVGCAEPDLSQAMPAPEFEPGTQPNTVLTHLGADMMYRRCRFVYAVEEVRSNKCGRQYPVAAGQHDFQSIEFSCDTVEDSTLAPGNVCTRQKQGQPPVCGQFDKFRYSVIEESNDSATREERLSVNITFLPLQRVLQQKPKYYVAIYGNAIKSQNNLERFIAGVNMTDVLGEMTNCAKFAADKSCLRFYSDNSIILDGLKRNTSYGVVLCAVLDPANLTFPPMIGADKSRKPQAFGLYLPAKGQHRHPGTGSSQEGGGDGTEDDEEADTEEKEERKKAEEFKAKRVVRLLVAGAVLLVALLALSVGIIFCWLRRQKEHLRKKRLNLEAMRRGREQRYTDFPSRRDDPWELERRNLILYEDKRLGAGAFGSVYLGKLVGIRRHQQQQGAGGSSGNSHNNNLSIGLLRAENTFVAVKMLPEYADEPSKSDFLREIGLMKTLGYHERLVNMLACVTQSEPYCLVVEFCSDGDLLQFLRHRCKYMLELEDAGVNYSDPECDADFDRTMIMTVKQLLMFAVQISYGLEYLSQKGFVHRDVAARNILVHEKTHAKIGDFGLCRFIYADSSNYKGRGGRLPIKWMSPEAIRHYEFTTSSDVWSFGVLMFEIITLGGTPYPGIQPDDMLAFLESGQRIVQPDNCPDEYYKVMHACWAADPRIRPDFGAVRQQLALQLENVSDEYAYLKLDAKKDYYNVSYGELKAQRGENVEEDLRKAAEEEAKKERRTKEKTEDEEDEDEEKDEKDDEEREVKEGGAEEKKEDEKKEDENGSSQMNPTQTRHHNVGIGIGNGIGIGLSSRERKEQQQQQLGAAGAEELVKVAA